MTVIPGARDPDPSERSDGGDQGTIAATSGNRVITTPRRYARWPFPTRQRRSEFRPPIGLFDHLSRSHDSRRERHRLAAWPRCRKRLARLICRPHSGEQHVRRRKSAMPSSWPLGNVFRTSRFPHPGLAQTGPCAFACDPSSTSPIYSTSFTVAPKWRRTCRTAVYPVSLGRDHGLDPVAKPELGQGALHVGF